MSFPAGKTAIQLPVITYRMPAPQGVIAGEIYEQSGTEARPAANVTVVLDSRSGKRLEAKTDSTGQFRFSGLSQKETYTVTEIDPDGKSNRNFSNIQLASRTDRQVLPRETFVKAEAVAAQGQAAQTAQPANPVAIIAGRVRRQTDEGDEAAANVAVVLESASGAKYQATTDSEGNFRFADVPAGQQYSVSAVDADAKQLAVQSGITVAANDFKTTALVIPLPPKPDEGVIEGSVLQQQPKKQSVALASAKVVLEGSAGTRLEATADSTGRFTFSKLKPDTYNLFAYAADGRRLPAGTEVTLLSWNDKKTANISERVTATMVGRPVQPDLLVPVGTVIERDQLQELPLYNRNFLALGLITQNTHDAEAGSALAGGTFSIAGARVTSNNFRLDGADNVASSSNQAIPFQVNEAIKEFRVTTANADARYGRGAGGVVDVVTQSGTDKFHGSAFGYFADDRFNGSSPLSVYNGSGFDRAAAYAGALNATPSLQPNSYNSYVAQAQALGKCTDPGSGASCAYRKFNPAAVLATNDSHTEPFSSRQAGIGMGGPLSKSVHIFGSYEGTRIENPNPIFERVPSSFDRTPVASLAGNVNGGLAQNVLKLYPTANVAAVPGVLEFYKGKAPNYTHVNNLLVKGDYKQKLNLRYSAQDLSQLHDDTLPEGGLYPGNGAIRDALNQNATVMYRHASGNLVQELRGGFTRFQVIETPQDQGFNFSSLGLPGPMTFLLSGLDPRYSGAAPGKLGAYAGWYDSFLLGDPNSLPATAITPIRCGTDLTNCAKLMQPTLAGFFPFARLGAPLSAPGHRRDSTAFGGYSLSFTHGSHNWEFGAEYRATENILQNGGFARGLVVSSDIGEFTSDAETCATDSRCTRQAFSTPSFDYAQRQAQAYAGQFTFNSVAGYAQELWKIKPRFTVNAGLRYEFFGMPVEKNHQAWNFVPAANGLVQQDTLNVVDPFGNTCGSGSARIGSIYAAAPQTTAPWNCSAAFAGKLMPENNTTNFAPRVGFAWDVTGQSKTVIRGAVGWFYDQLPSNFTSQLIFNRPTFLNAANPQLIYGQNFLTAACGTQIFGTGGYGQCGLGNVTLNPKFIAANPAFGGGNTQIYQSASSPFGIYALDPANFLTPRSRQVTGSFQQQLHRNLVLEAGYIGADAERLPVVANSGFNHEWFCNADPRATSSQCDTISQFPVFTMSDVGSSSYRSVYARLRMAQWHGLTLNTSYVWSQSRDNASNAEAPLLPTTLLNQMLGVQYYGLGNQFPVQLGLIPQLKSGFANSAVATPFVNVSEALNTALTTTGARQVFVSRYTIPQDPYNFLRNDWGPSDFDSPHRVVIDYVWRIPGRANSFLLDGWEVSGILMAQSGQPFSIFAGSAGGELTQRVNLSSAVTTTGNPAAFLNAPVGLASLSGSCATSFYASAPLFSGTTGTPCLGNSRRNLFSGPNYFANDMAVQKRFRISTTERTAVVVRAEFFNVFNRANYYNPISQYSVDGVTVNPDFGKVKSAYAPRQMQFAIRFNW